MRFTRREVECIQVGKAIVSATERAFNKLAEMSEQDYDGEVAEPFRFNFEIAWEVANKGRSVGSQLTSKQTFFSYFTCLRVLYYKF